MFKYVFRIKTNLLESLWSQKNPLKAHFRKTSDNDIVLAQNEFLGLVGAPNDSLRLNIIHNMIKCTFGIKTTFLESLRSRKSP